MIDGYVEGMIDQVLPTTPTELGLVSDEVRRLRRLSDDLSALSRAEEGRLALAPAAMDLDEVARAAAERLRPQIEDAGLSLAVESSGPLPVSGDADRLAQVVTNLVGNALRATATGTITVRTTRVGGRPAVQVSDTGEGIAPPISNGSSSASTGCRDGAPRATTQDPESA